MVVYIIWACVKGWERGECMNNFVRVKNSHCIWHPNTFFISILQSQKNPNKNHLKRGFGVDITLIVSISGPLSLRSSNSSNISSMSGGFVSGSFKSWSASESNSSCCNKIHCAKHEKKLKDSHENYRSLKNGTGKWVQNHTSLKEW